MRAVGDEEVEPPEANGTQGCLKSEESSEGDDDDDEGSDIEASPLHSTSVILGSSSARPTELLNGPLTRAFLVLGLVLSFSRSPPGALLDSPT